MFFRDSKVVQQLAALVERLQDELAGERAGRHYMAQRMAELKVEHERLVAELQRRLAISQANFEWLSVSYNRAEVERSQLLLGRVGLRSAPIAVDTGDASAPPAARDVGAEREAADSRRLKELLENGRVAAGIFDDMGDTAAQAEGLERGEVYDGRLTQ